MQYSNRKCMNGLVNSIRGYYIIHLLYQNAFCYKGHLINTVINLTTCM